MPQPLAIVEEEDAIKRKLSIYITTDTEQQMRDLAHEAQRQAGRAGKSRRAASMSAVVEEALAIGLSHPDLIRRILARAEKLSGDDGE